MLQNFEEVKTQSKQTLVDGSAVPRAGIDGQWLHCVEWGECDPAGIVFYPNFYRWFDASSHHMMNKHGFGQTKMISRYGIVGFALIDSGAEFIWPIQWEDEVLVSSRITKHSRKTMTVLHEIHVIENPQQLCVTGFEVRIWGMKDEKTGTMKAWDLPDEFVRYLDANSD